MTSHLFLLNNTGLYPENFFKKKAASGLAECKGNFESKRRVSDLDCG